MPQTAGGNLGLQLGQLLFGQPDDSSSYLKGQLTGSQVQSAMETARLARAKALNQEGQNEAVPLLGEAAAKLGLTPEQSAGYQTLGQAGGGDASVLAKALGLIRGQGYQADARTAALGGDLNAANANLFGLADKPVDLAKITNGIAYNPTVTPDAGNLTITPLGEADIALKDAQAVKGSFVDALPLGDGTTQAGFIDPATRTFAPITRGGGLGTLGDAAPAGAPMMDFATLARTTGATMTSGLRSPEHNAEVGGEPNSQHVAGTAADFAVRPEQKPAFVAQAQAMGYTAIDEGDHIHLQVNQGLGSMGGDPGTGVRVGMGGGAPAEPPTTMARAPQLAFGQAPAKATDGDMFAKNKAFADQLRTAGAITTDEEYQHVLMTGKTGDFQGNTNVKPFGDDTKTGPEYLQTLTGGNADIVKGLLNGTVQLPTGTALKNGFWQSALASAKRADPTWNQAAYKQYADTRKFMTTGQGGKLINSINTGAQHLQKLVEDINALDNSNVRPLAAAGNYLSSNLGGQAVTNFTGDLTPVASELASIYKNGGTPTDQETQHWREALSPNMSRGQQLNVVRGWIDLLAGKLNATHDQYRAAMSPLSDPLNVINPEAAQALEQVTQLANTVSTTGQHEAPAPNQAPINAPGRQAAPATHAVGDIITHDGKQYRVTGGDPNDPDVELVQ